MWIRTATDGRVPRFFAIETCINRGTIHCRLSFLHHRRYFCQLVRNCFDVSLKPFWITIFIGSHQYSFGSERVNRPCSRSRRLESVTVSCKIAYWYFQLFGGRRRTIARKLCDIQTLHFRVSKKSVLGLVVETGLLIELIDITLFGKSETIPKLSNTKQIYRRGPEPHQRGTYRHIMII